ncbi:hypothetical protein [Cellulosimicrobium cellulans]|uniref:Uncharacterized protein n=1 Tax=Cellulosimicrobium cellulans TaxID=1710 RepID=A0A4Y4E1R8_CELCE|nr:hypothetical protein [Cellulosimicrobium cellulans]GED09964.1 hypothetical protein CCE02nite_19630 [Cellulosimicrobium cellulans]
MTVRRTRSITAVGVCTALLISVGATGASASTRGGSGHPGPQDLADTTASLIAEVAPDQGQVLTGAQRSGAVVTGTPHVDATVPLDGDEPVVLEDATDRTPPLTVSLPAETSTHDGQVATDGTVVYEAVDDGAHAAVQALDDGSVRIQTITPSADGPHAFTYTFGDGITPVEGRDGAVELVQEIAPGVALTVGQVSAPWAADADGAPLSTTYRIDGDALVQTVDTDAGTTYPVVADPKITKTWWNTTVYLNRYETRRLADGAQVTAFVAGLVPHAVAKAIGAMAQAGSLYARIWYNEGKCIKFVYYLNRANVWQPYAGAEAGRYCR